jgi:hypothetical protein
MIKKTLLLAAAVGFGLGLFASSCGGSKDPCVNIVCEGALRCDPTDLECKCGGRGGVVCGQGFKCDEVANTCTPTRCAGVDCNDKPGTSCDVLDGLCRCGGTGGAICGANEVCNPNAKACVPVLNCNEIACGKNQTCDNTTGRCKCAQLECMPGQFCSVSGGNGAKTCVTNICSGVKCAGTTVCDPADGYCKCNGAICQSGEACSCPPACADTARVCKPGSACTGVVCNGGTTCDPVDGQCKCGGPGGPTCTSVQICALGPPPQCQGGAQCVNPDGGTKSCAGGTSCDPEDGKCKCGGRGGEVCKPAMAMDLAEICVSNPQQKACKRPCDVRAPDCAMGTFCYFDPTAATPAAYCSPATDTKVEEAACATATACLGANPARSLNCTGLAAGAFGICRAYCDVAVGPAGCIQVPKANLCVQISGAPAGYGFCQPQN